MATVEEKQPTAVPEAEGDPQENTDRMVKGDKVELTESDAWDKLGYSFPTWRKW